jgi:diacylglycerol kinase family enzyme
MPGLLIHNPDSGRKSSPTLEELAAATGAKKSMLFSELGEPKDAVRIAKEEGCEWIAVSGGDGSVEAIASSLIDSDMPLGVIPTGTFNNFAKSLDLPLDVTEACKIIRDGKVKRIDVGYANGKPFFECVGAGLDAELFPASEEVKSGNLLNFIELLKKANRFKPSKIRLILDRPAKEAVGSCSSNPSHHLIRHIAKIESPAIALTALLVTASNGPYYGMNFAVAPEERMDDGMMTVTVFSRYSKIQLWWHFLSIAFGRKAYSPKSISFRVAKVTIDAASPLPSHTDGTPFSGWPLNIECKAGALPVFVR